MPSICIITSSHLCRNPRVIKEATTLAENGYDVTVLRPLFSDELAEQDQQICSTQKWHCKTTIDLRSEHVSWMQHTWARAKRTAGAYAVEWFQIGRASCRE